MVLARSLAWMAGGQNLGKIRKYLIKSAKDTVLTFRVLMQVRYEQGEQQQICAGQQLHQAGGEELGGHQAPAGRLHAAS